MTDSTLIDVVETGFEGWNTRDYEKIASRVTDDYVFETDALPHPLRGREAFLDFAHTYLTAFPDLHFEFTDLFAAPDRVVACWTATGTHLGELNGVAPSGQRVRVQGCTVTQFVNGRVASQRAFWDSSSLMRQIERPGTRAGPRMNPDDGADARG